SGDETVVATNCIDREIRRQEVLRHQPIRRDRPSVQGSDLCLREGPAPYAYLPDGPFEIALKIPRADAHRRSAGPRVDVEVVIRTPCVPTLLVAVAAPELTVLVDRGTLQYVVGNPDDVNLRSRGDRILKVAADALSPGGVEDVEADPVGSRRAVCGNVVVHAKSPLLGACLSLPQPVDIARAFGRGEGQDVRPDPSGHAQAGIGHTELTVIGNLDVVVSAVKLKRKGRRAHPRPPG